MTWITAVALTLQGVLALIAFYRQGVSHQQQTQHLLEQAQAERSELLTRIQHPEVRYFPSQPQEPYDPPRDAGELAFIGQIVPDGYHIGEPIEPPDQNP